MTRKTFLIVAVFAAAVALLYSAAAHGLESEMDHLAQIPQIKPGPIIADVGAVPEISVAKQVANRSRLLTELYPELVDEIQHLAGRERAISEIPVARKPDNTTAPFLLDGIFLSRV